MWDLTASGEEEVWVYQRMTDGSRVQFVARFKYMNAAESAEHFMKFLEENFTVEEYFAARGEGKAPLTILQEKGYVSYNLLQVNR